MSHVVTIELEIDNLEVLSDAAKSLGCTLIKNQKTYSWYGYHVGDYPLPQGFKKEDMGKCEHAIKVDGSQWEIGVVKDPENEKKFKLIYDFYGAHGRDIEKVCGKGLGKLKARYTVAELKHKLNKKKAKYKEEVKNGKIRLTIQA